MSTVSSTSTQNVSPEECLAREDIEKREDTEKSPIENIAEIPDGGYGWFIVVACFLINFNTWGANSGFAIYLSTYLNDGTFAGADKYDYSLIGGMTFGVGLVFSPVVNWTQGKIGVRCTIIIGMFFQFAGLLMASYAVSLWELYLTQGMLQAFGLAFMSIPAISILPQWFKKKRTFAASVAAAGSGCGGLVYNLGMQQVIDARSVQWALRAQAIMCFGLCWFSVALIRTRIRYKQTLFDFDVVKTAGFYICLFYTVFCILGYVVVLYDMANFTTSLGYSSFQGSIASAMVQVGSVVGRPIVGRASDFVGPITVTCLAYLLSAIFVFGLWIPARNYATIIVFCLIEGSLMGTIFSTIAPLCSKLFGLRYVGVSISMLWIFIGLAGIGSPVIGIALKTDSGSDEYLYCSIFAGCAFIACTLMLLVMRGYVVHRHDISDTDADHGHMHLTVPLMEPFRCAFKLRAKI